MLFAAFVLGVDFGVVAAVGVFFALFDFGVCFGVDGVGAGFFGSLAAVGVEGTGLRDAAAADCFAGSLQQNESNEIVYFKHCITALISGLRSFSEPIVKAV